MEVQAFSLIFSFYRDKCDFADASPEKLWGLAIPDR